MKGGTAILKTNGPPYRFSYDLDFSCFREDGKADKHYKDYKKPLEKLVIDLGYKIVSVDGGEVEENKKHTESGLIFKIHLTDEAKYLKRPIKFSVSCIDKKPFYAPEIKLFKTIVTIPNDEKFSRLYPKLIPEINKINVKMLIPEELCSEKIRALATRGSSDQWHLVLRDVVDLYMMDQKGLLNRVFKNNRDCVKYKFLAIQKRAYWKKFEEFLQTDSKVNIKDDDRVIFFDKNVIDAKRATDTVKKVKKNLRGIYDEISKEGKNEKPNLLGTMIKFLKGKLG